MNDERISLLKRACREENRVRLSIALANVASKERLTIVANALITLSQELSPVAYAQRLGRIAGVVNMFCDCMFFIVSS